MDVELIATRRDVQRAVEAMPQRPPTLGTARVASFLAEARLRLSEAEIDALAEHLVEGASFPGAATRWIE